MTELKIEYIPIDQLKPYEKNARKHQDADVETIVNSIREFGFDDPIGVWGEDNIIVEGHGRLLAAKKLSMDTVPVIRLDHLTDEQRRAYALAHNQTTLNSEWDFGILGGELDDIFEIDMSQFGFELAENEEPAETENIYTDKVDIPQYEPSGENVELSDLFDKEKYEVLVAHIKQSNISDDEKFFLCMAAARHLRFSYKKIADYYASKASKEMQSLMEESALVLIDYNDAIKNGYAILRKTVTDLMTEDGYGA